jgi:hypothetical protein
MGLLGLALLAVAPPGRAADDGSMIVTAKSGPASLSSNLHFAAGSPVSMDEVIAQLKEKAPVLHSNGINGPLVVLPPLTAYTISSMAAIAAGGSLDSAVGAPRYHYMIESTLGEAVANAEYLLLSNGKPSMGLGMGGTEVGAVKAALDDLVHLDRLRAGSYEVRILREHANYVGAIWLKSDIPGGDFIYGLPAPGFSGLKAQTLYPMAEFLAIYRGSIRAVMAPVVPSLETVKTALTLTPDQVLEITPILVEMTKAQAEIVAAKTKYDADFTAALATISAQLNASQRPLLNGLFIVSGRVPRDRPAPIPILSALTIALSLTPDEVNKLAPILDGMIKARDDIVKAVAVCKTADASNVAKIRAQLTDQQKPLSDTLFGATVIRRRGAVGADGVKPAPGA